jgi:hypothetical protein
MGGAQSNLANAKKVSTTNVLRNSLTKLMTKLDAAAKAGASANKIINSMPNSNEARQVAKNIALYKATSLGMANAAAARAKRAARGGPQAPTEGAAAAAVNIAANTVEEAASMGVKDVVGARARVNQALASGSNFNKYLAELNRLNRTANNNMRNIKGRARTFIPGSKYGRFFNGVKLGTATKAPSLWRENSTSEPSNVLANQYLTNRYLLGGMKTGNQLHNSRNFLYKIVLNPATSTWNYNASTNTYKRTKAGRIVRANAPLTMAQAANMASQASAAAGPAFARAAALLARNEGAPPKLEGANINGRNIYSLNNGATKYARRANAPNSNYYQVVNGNEGRPVYANNGRVYTFRNGAFVNKSSN